MSHATLSHAQTHRALPGSAMPARALLLAALVGYAGATVWSFVVWPLQTKDGLYFYYFQGLQATVQLFAPLVLLLVCVITRGRLRGAAVLVSFVSLVWLLFPSQSPYLYGDNQGGHTLHVISLLLCAATGLMLAEPWRWMSLPAVRWSPLPVRRVGATLLAVTAVTVFFGMAPAHTTSPSMISAALSSDQLNQSNAQGAPQQAVVNGWTARDLLAIIAQQGEEGRDERPPVFAFLALLAVLLFVGTSSRGGAASAASTRPGLLDAGIGAGPTARERVSYGGYPSAGPAGVAPSWASAADLPSH